MQCFKCWKSKPLNGADAVAAIDFETVTGTRYFITVACQKVCYNIYYRVSRTDYFTINTSVALVRLPPLETFCTDRQLAMFETVRSTHVRVKSNRCQLLYTRFRSKDKGYPTEMEVVMNMKQARLHMRIV